MACYGVHKSRSIDSIHDPLGSSSRPHVTTYLEDNFKSILPSTRLCITPYKVGTPPPKKKKKGLTSKLGIKHHATGG